MLRNLSCAVARSAVAVGLVCSAALGQTTASTTRVATTAPTSAPTTTAAATRPADIVNPALAERMTYQMAQGLLRARPISATSWSATVALLEGAARLNPDEPRILRMLTEALLREGDVDRALE